MADLDRLQAALSALADFCLLPTPEELHRRLESAGDPATEKTEPVLGAQPPLGRSEDGGRLVYLFSSPASAQEALEAGALPGVDEIVVLDRRPVREVLERWKSEPETLGVEIDPGSPHALRLTAADLERLCERLARGRSAAAPTPAPALVKAAPVKLPARPAVHTLPPWPLTGQPAAASRERITRWIRANQSRALSDMRTWLFLESVAFEMDFFVPVERDRAAGFSWPQCRPHARNPDRTVVHLYTSEGGIEAALRELPSEQRRHVRVSGLEALRWITALPTRADLVCFDDFPGSKERYEMPRAWAALPLFPLAYPIATLEEIEAPPLSELAGLPGARGTHPKVLRALSAESARLLTLVDASGTPALVSTEQGRAVAAFSDAERWQEFRARRELEPALRPVAAGGVPPFVRWLGAAADAQGVVLDPGTRGELWLDHAALVAIAAWTILPTHPLSADHYLAALLTARNQSALSESVQGRMLAACPYWYQPVVHGESGPRPLRDPFSGDQPLFGDEGLAREWLEMLESVSALPESAGVIRLLPRWKASPFDGALERRVSLAIQPTELGTCEFRIGTVGQTTAAIALDHVLQPRVPDFLPT
jgi:hypothetical protein